MSKPARDDGRPAELHPPFAQPDRGDRAQPSLNRAGAACLRRASPSPDSVVGDLSEVDASALPPIEDFIDDLPSIQEFLMVTVMPAQPQALSIPDPVYAPLPQAPATALETDAEGWASADWQSYDWSGLAALATPRPEAAEAHHAWSSTNWDAAGRRRTAGRHSEEAG